jgi:protein-S-isoprenylcysteine O-methyltransferase Ste14
MCTGSVLMYQTIALFATIGKGTLAPWDPPKNLVVNGIYRHVRNPMISGVCFLLLGETLIMGSSSQAIWTLTFWLANVIYLPLVEEPKLDKRFGEDYENYKKNVPRWIPMRTAWNPDSSDSP